LECEACESRSLVPFSKRSEYKEGIAPERCNNCSSFDTKYLVRPERGGSLKIILAEFERIGYTCNHRSLNAADFGVPQLRERLIIVGTLEGKDFSWPKPKFRKTAVVKEQASLFDLDLPERRTMRDTLMQNLNAEFGHRAEKDLVLWVKNVVRPHDEPVTWSLDRPSPTIGAHQSAKLAFAPGGVPEKQLYRQQWATKGRRQGDTPPVDVEHRYLTDEELLKLQSFPEWWFLFGTRMERAFQIGNAVPPLLGAEIGRSILEAENNV
jgi:DNA (cytosine-5)-methyltransferase 1